jgi:hypothetical protein
VPADGIVGRHPCHAGQRPIPGPDRAVWIEDHNAIAAVFNDSVEAGTLIVDLLVEPGVLHCDSGLVGEIGQHLLVVGGEGYSSRTEDVDQADDLVFDGHRQGDNLTQWHAGCGRRQAEAGTEVWHLPILTVCGRGQVAPQSIEKVDGLHWQPIASPRVESGVLTP